eukprot:1509919-Amphidinium_carterae.1
MAGIVQLFIPSMFDPNRNLPIKQRQVHSSIAIVEDLAEVCAYNSRGMPPKGLAELQAVLEQAAKAA